MIKVGFTTVWESMILVPSRFKYPPPPLLHWSWKTSGRLLGAGRKTGRPWFQKLFR